VSAPDDYPGPNDYPGFCPGCEGTGRELIEGAGTGPCPFGCTPPKPIPGSTACPKCHGSGQVGDEVCPLGCLVPLVTPAMLAKLDVVEARLERVRARVEQMRAIRAERAEA